MSSDSGGGGLCGLLGVGALYWMGVALAPVVGLALIGNVVMWAWIILIVGASAVFSLITYGLVGGLALEERDWWMLVDVVMAPIVTFWLGWHSREALRHWWVGVFDEYGALAGMFAFFFFLACIPLSVAGLAVTQSETIRAEINIYGPAGALLRLIAGYLPMWFAIGSWMALILNSVDPLPTK